MCVCVCVCVCARARAHALDEVHAYLSRQARIGNISLRNDGLAQVAGAKSSVEIFPVKYAKCIPPD